jgi:hypothetical protein
MGSYEKYIQVGPIQQSNLECQLINPGNWNYCELIKFYLGDERLFDN